MSKIIVCFFFQTEELSLRPYFLVPVIYVIRTTNKMIEELCVFYYMLYLITCEYTYLNCLLTVLHILVKIVMVFIECFVCDMIRYY